MISDRQDFPKTAKQVRRRLCLYISLLRSVGYKYVIGARIKNESTEPKEWVLSLPKDYALYEYKRGEADRLIVGYSEKCALKDAYNRDKGITRLQNHLKVES